MTQDLFGEQRIQIKGDAYLNKIAQHIYDLVTRQPELLKGDTMNRIYRQIQIAMMFDSGLMSVLKSGDKEKFTEWFLSKECPTEEETARATRGLLEADLIRLPASVIKHSEQFRQRIAQSIKR